MKKKGNVCEYTCQRDQQLCKEFRRQLSEATFINLPEIFRKVALSPAPRYYVSEQRAFLVINQWRSTGEMPVNSRLRRKMFEEIAGKADSLMKRNPEMSLYDAVFDAVNSAATSFFLTPGSARTIIYKALV